MLLQNYLIIWIMSIMGPGLLKRLFTRSDSDDSAFIGIMRVAREDPSVRATLITILSLENFQRSSALGSLVDQMKLQSAPKEFVDALELFHRDEIAVKALKMLQDDQI